MYEKVNDFYHSSFETSQCEIEKKYYKTRHMTTVRKRGEW